MKKLLILTLLLILLVGCVKETTIEENGIQTEKEIPKESKMEEMEDIDRPKCPGISINVQCYKGGLQISHTGMAVPINKFKIITDKYGEESYEIYLGPSGITLFGEGRYSLTNVTIIPITIENREEIICEDSMIKINCP